MAITTVLRRLISTNIKQTARNFHATSIIRSGAYEGDGKTTLSILNKDLSYGLMIDSYSTAGFRLNNGIMIVGPIAIFPRTILSWKIGGLNDINEETLSLFSIFDPKLDILVIGIGSDQRTPEFDKRMLNYGNKYKMNMEIVPTNQACAIFNFLNAEGRFVAGGIIPPHVVPFSESEILDSSQNVKVVDDPLKLTKY